MTPRSATEAGFTLLEVLVALAVFAVLAVASGTAMQHVLNQSQGLQERLFASWVANNHLTQLRLQRNLAPGQRRLTVRFAHQAWIVEERRSLQGTAGLLQIDLRVRLGRGQPPVYQTLAWLEGTHDAQ